MTAVGYLRGDWVEVIVCRGSVLSYPRHNHVSTLTVGLVLEGAVELATDRGTELCRENSLFAFPPYVPHSLNARAPYTLVSLCVSKERIVRGDPGEAREAAAALLRKALRPRRHLVELSLGQDRNDAGRIVQPCSAGNADAVSGKDFVGFQLGLVNVGADGFAGGDADQMIAELPAGLPACDEVLELHAREGLVGIPRELSEGDLPVRKAQPSLRAEAFK